MHITDLNITDSNGRLRCGDKYVPRGGAQGSTRHKLRTSMEESEENQL